jgi:hypothetical protein
MYACMCGYSYSILSNAIVICMHDGLWYGITVQLMQTISTYYGAINSKLMMLYQVSTEILYIN